MTSGPRVRHRSYGDGVVVGDPSVPTPTVDFGYMTTAVPRDELIWIDRPENQADQGPTPTVESSGLVEQQQQHTLSEETVRARRAILALKLGQVLEDDVEDLSVGTADIRRRLEQALDAAVQRQPRSILIEGAWGAGKTHLLTLLTALARAREFCTAQVILDGEGVTLSEPMGLMEGILSSLRYPNEEIPIGIGSRLLEVRRRHDYFELKQRIDWRLAAMIVQTPVEAFEDPDALEVLQDYLMLTVAKTRAQEKLRTLGYGVDLPTIKAWPLRDRPGRFRKLLASWAEFCVLTGARGLVVVFDEVDVEYAATLGDYYRRGLRSELLEALGDLREWRCPILLAFGSAPHGGAEEEDAATDLAHRLEGTVRVQAPQPDFDQARKLGRRLQTLYGRAYPNGTVNSSTRVRVNALAKRYAHGLNPTLREFVRGTLELLDVASSSRAAQGPQ